MLIIESTMKKSLLLLLFCFSFSSSFASWLLEYVAEPAGAGTVSGNCSAITTTNAMAWRVYANPNTGYEFSHWSCSYKKITFRDETAAETVCDKASTTYLYGDVTYQIVAHFVKKKTYTHNICKSFGRRNGHNRRGNR